MAALDTNILVRWLTNDNEAQCAAIAKRIDSALRLHEALFVPITVILELEWVLRSRYRFDKASITAAMDALLGVAVLEIQDESAVEVAMWLFRKNDSADFADCLHIALADKAARSPLLTLDRRASRIKGAQFLA